jgi:hypothetical protein
MTGRCSVDAANVSVVAGVPASDEPELPAEVVPAQTARAGGGARSVPDRREVAWQSGLRGPPPT